MAMTLRLSERDKRALALLAEADGVSKHEATIRAIHEVARRRGHEARVADASQRVRARYADVIERLGR
ncbi:MAG: CopG family transcriptional regulator [Propionibacteriaceae bacterium]|nr:CopG family transcriptional regulator [Propionibacterium ruminifibrarum]MBE6477316.1 CopG family transcriptional regulator [Propionibacteriaceae bacterium]